MSESTAALQQRIDTLARSIQTCTKTVRKTHGRENINARTQLWGLIGWYLEAAPAEQILSMIASGDIPKDDNDMGSPLGLAAEKHLAHLIEPLVRAGCDINREGAENMTPLEHAVANSGPNSDKETVATLLKLGAAGSRSESILNFAAYCGHANNVEAILEHGISVDHVCPVDGTTALVTALQNLDAGPRVSQTIKLLLQHGADPAKPSSNFEHQGAVFWPVDLLAAATINELPERDLCDIAALMVGKALTATDVLRACARARMGNDALAIWALRNGANPDGVTQGGQTLFQSFAQHGMHRAVTHMLEHYNESGDQLHPSGKRLIDMVSDEATLRALHSQIARENITSVIDSTDAEHSAPPRKNTSFSL